MSNYYGYRCYDSEGNALGWFYTFGYEEELNSTTTNLDWCKRWKTERGAKKNFDYYNERWKFRKDGYLKIEIMPEKPPDIYERQQKWQQENPEVVQKSKAKYDAENPVWSLRIKADIREWLEAERWSDETGEPETNAALINRKLEKLMKLEQQGL